MPVLRAVIGLGITQIIGWGTTFYALGALSPDIIADRGWPKALVFAAFSLALLLSGLVSRAAGRAIDVYGGRRSMAAGSLLAAAGCTILGLAASPWIYFAGWAVLGLAMRFTLYDAAFPSLTQVAGPRSRRAISYLTLFGGLASTVFWPVSHLLSESIGWRNTFLVYAVLQILICLPIHLKVLVDKPVGPDRESAADERQPVGASPLIGRDRVTAIALFATVVALNGLVFSSVSAHVVPLFESLGFSSVMAVTLAAMIGPSQVASRIGDILAGHRITTMAVGLIAVGLLPTALFVFATGAFALRFGVAFAILYGMSNGLVTITRGVVPLALFGRDGYGLVLGTIAAPQLVLNALAPTLFAFLLDSSGPRTSLLVALAVSLLSLLAMIYLARRYPR
ncbi:MAG: MFS transporter [Hyphomicrobiales bacterium]